MSGYWTIDAGPAFNFNRMNETVKRIGSTAIMLLVLFAVLIVSRLSPLADRPPEWSVSVDHELNGHVFGEFAEAMRSPQATLRLHCDSDWPKGDITLTIPAAGSVRSLSVLADGKPIASGPIEMLQTDGDDNLVLYLARQDMVVAVRSVIDAKLSIRATIDFADGKPLVADFNTNGSAAAGLSLLPACGTSP